MQWIQIYDPLGHWWASTLVAALPIIVLFSLLAGFKVKPHWCAIAGALTAMAVAIVIFKMPVMLAVTSFGYGVAFGILKIAWIVPNVGVDDTRRGNRGLLVQPKWLRAHEARRAY